MNNEEIIQKLLDKAVDNGWLIDGQKVIKAVYKPITKREWIEIWKTNDLGCDMEISVFNFYFKHDFAKAFWGTDKDACIICGSEEFEGKRSGSPMDTEDWVKLCKKCGVEAIDINEFGIPDGSTLKAWQYNLQQMVLEEEPIKYLEKF